MSSAAQFEHIANLPPSCMECAIACQRCVIFIASQSATRLLHSSRKRVYWIVFRAISADIPDIASLVAFQSNPNFRDFSDTKRPLPMTR